MANIGYLLEIPREAMQYEFLVEQLHEPAYENNESTQVCILVGPQSPWFHKIHAYLLNRIISPHLTRTQRKKTLFAELPITLSSPKPYIVVVIMIFSLNV